MVRSSELVDSDPGEPDPCGPRREQEQRRWRGGKRASADCGDHIDNDGDGYCDYAWSRGYCSDGSKLGDPDCQSKDDSSEACTARPETCDGQDNDCDRVVDEGGVCDTVYYCDADRDAYTNATASGTCSFQGCVPAGCTTTPGTDCNDSNSQINPAAVENCDANSVDDDCDGSVDECNRCLNGVLDGDESDVDCGGSCTACEVGAACGLDADCLSRNCSSGICANAPTVLDPACVPLKFDSGSTASQINLVFVPSAFGGDMALFRQKVEWIASIFGDYTPFDPAISTYNVFYVTEEAGDYCAFNCNGIARLLCCDSSLARNLSARCTTGSRQTVVVHNSTTYGGAGYPSADMATTSVHSSAPRIAVHELGHSLFNLGDEYDYGYSSPSYPNCDYAGCSRWQDLIGYNGVNCLSGNCQGGAYFASESTLMKSLSYPFEEVNERLSCCTYALETGRFPSYCDRFEALTSGGLDSFCQNPNGAGVAAVPADYVENPEEITWRRDPDSGEWIVENRAARRPGFYPQVQTRGQGKGQIVVSVGLGNGERKDLLFDSSEDVEFPLEGDALGGFTQRARQTLSVVVDRKNNGRIRSLTVHDGAR